MITTALLPLTNLVFRVKDTMTNQPLLQGRSRNGLNPVPFQHSIVAASTTVASPRSGLSWHRRVGHPNVKTIAALSKAFPSLCITSLRSVCSSCALAKSHRLPFSPSYHVSSLPLDLLLVDVWGPSPIFSYNGFRYFLLIIDDKTRYSWLFLLKQKYEVTLCLINFINVIEKQLKCSVRTHRNDGGGEFQNTTLKSFTTTHGITHQFTCPYTPQQNGVSERKNCHLLATARTLLLDAHLPSSFWYDAILTDVFLINRLSSPNTSSKSPYHLLYQNPPDYSILRPFGCRCFPWTKPLTPNKLAPRSVPYIFIGYTIHNKGFKCYDPATTKIIVSRHVLFDESLFPSITLPETPIAQPSPELPYFPPSYHSSIQAPSTPQPSPSLSSSTPQTYSSNTPTIPQISHSTPTTTSLLSLLLYPNQLIQWLHGSKQDILNLA
ncbi:hypothetical protein KFK09_018888 [Dendrobium nobile]|uniref:Integrase catalytic domain-containing protein n=1 Tax=Dendrobium nobile TaxID=94219 RepID=A0A8T3AYC2_DENNO|nr:hypothetical protein KFK09_018888 [Dendrobium nobile]